MKPLHTIALSGSYHGDLEKLAKSLPGGRILEMSLIGREISLKVRSEDFEEVKKSLKKLGVSNISILEWRKVGATFESSGKGFDVDKNVQVSLIPSELGEGIRELAFLSAEKIDEKILKKISEKIGEILYSAGVTDALYTVNIMKKISSEEGYINAAIMATLNAICEAGGIVKIEED